MHGRMAAALACAGVSQSMWPRGGCFSCMLAAGRGCRPTMWDVCYCFQMGDVRRLKLLPTQEELEQLQAASSASLARSSRRRQGWRGLW